MVTDIRNNEHLITIDMGKGIGLISGHTKKVGNTVGFRNSASNNGQTQGYRVYQPIVRNPQTAAQAEQRAKTAAINATYSHLKMIIDRGNESLPYGNRSRCAWLKKAFKAELIPWFQRDVNPYMPVCCELTHGSLNSIFYEVSEDYLIIFADHVHNEDTIDTVSDFSTHIKQAFPFLRDGDQITFVAVGEQSWSMFTKVMSIVIDENDDTQVNGFDCMEGQIAWECGVGDACYAVIVSREGAAGKHLRSTANLIGWSNIVQNTPYNSASKSAAIASYQTSQSANNDWQEDSQ